MLTISINEALAMGPEPWSAPASEWHGDDYSWTGYEGGAMQSGYGASQWEEASASPHANDASSWDAMPWNQGFACGDWSTLAMDDQQQSLPWRLPHSSHPDDVRNVKQSAWSSPLRVPLPEPVGADSSSLVSEAELEAQLTDAAALPGMTLARAASCLQQEEAAAPLRVEAVAPPQLELPPGLHESLEELVSGIDPPPAAAAQPMLRKPGSSSEVAMPPGMSIHVTEGCTRVEWQIEDLRSRLLANMGRPLVSPSISALNLPNLRLMIFPDARQVLKNARSNERKKLYDNMIKKGPLHGALKLKADCFERATVMRFNLTVGSMRVGPMTFDFSDQAIHDGHGSDDFAMDWLKQVDKQNGSLCVGIEILEVNAEATRSS